LFVTCNLSPNADILTTPACPPATGRLMITIISRTKSSAVSTDCAGLDFFFFFFSAANAACCAAVNAPASTSSSTAVTCFSCFDGFEIAAAAAATGDFGCTVSPFCAAANFACSASCNCFCCFAVIRAAYLSFFVFLTSALNQCRIQTSKHR
jgi:hypothetical protein